MMQIRCNTCQTEFEVKHITEPTMECPHCGPIRSYTVLHVVAMQPRFAGQVVPPIKINVRTRVKPADLQAFLDEWGDGTWKK